MAHLSDVKPCAAVEKELNSMWVCLDEESWQKIKEEVLETIAARDRRVYELVIQNSTISEVATIISQLVPHITPESSLNNNIPLWREAAKRTLGRPCARYGEQSLEETTESVTEGDEIERVLFELPHQARRNPRLHFRNAEAQARLRHTRFAQAA